MSTEASQNLSNLAAQENDAKSQYFSSVNVNQATLINTAKKNAVKLCAASTSNPDIRCY